MHTRLKDLREEHDLKQNILSEILSVSQSSYSRYENGTKDISIKSLKILSNYYGSSIDYILYMTDVRRLYGPSANIVLDNRVVRKLQISSFKIINSTN